MIKLKWSLSHKEFVIDFSNKKKTIHITEEFCNNNNLRNLLMQFNKNRSLEILKSIKLIDNENRYLVFSCNDCYKDIELLGLYNNITDLNKINLIDDLNQHKDLFKEITFFKFKENFKLERNSVDYYNQIKSDEEIKKYNLTLENKNNRFNIKMSNKQIKKNNISRIQKSYKEKIEKSNFYFKNKDLFDLVNLDFNIQNIIVESTKCNLYFYLKEKNIFIKLKSNKSKHLHLEEKEYNLPLLPTSF